MQANLFCTQLSKPARNSKAAAQGLGSLFLAGPRVPLGSSAEDPAFLDRKSADSKDLAAGLEPNEGGGLQRTLTIPALQRQISLGSRPGWNLQIAPSLDGPKTPSNPTNGSPKAVRACLIAPPGSTECLFLLSIFAAGLYSLKSLVPGSCKIKDPYLLQAEILHCRSLSRESPSNLSGSESTTSASAY